MTPNETKETKEETLTPFQSLMNKFSTVRTLGNKIEKYSFRDEHGHPLENCADFQKLVVLAEQGELYLRDTLADFEKQIADGFDYEDMAEFTENLCAGIREKLNAD